MGIHFAILVAFLTTGIVAALCNHFDLCSPQIYGIVATLVTGALVEIFWLTRPRPNPRRRHMKRTKTLVNDLNKAMRPLNERINQLSEEEQDKLPWGISQLVYDWVVICNEGKSDPIDTGPENERGRSWFGNDGIDCQRTRVAPA